MDIAIDLSAVDTAEFDWMRALVAPPPDEGELVSGIQIATVLHDCAVDLVSETFGVGGPESLSALDVRPILSGLGATFARPMVSGKRVFSGSTLGAMSEKSFSLVSGLWTGDDRRLIAQGTASFVTIDVQSRRAVPVPTAVVDALRTLRPQMTQSDRRHDHAERP